MRNDFLLSLSLILCIPQLRPDFIIVKVCACVCHSFSFSKNTREKFGTAPIIIILRVVWRFLGHTIGDRKAKANEFYGSSSSFHRCSFSSRCLVSLSGMNNFSPSKRAESSRPLIFPIPGNFLGEISLIRRFPWFASSERSLDYGRRFQEGGGRDREGGC